MFECIFWSQLLFISCVVNYTVLEFDMEPVLIVSESCISLSHSIIPLHAVNIHCTYLDTDKTNKILLGYTGTPEPMGQGGQLPPLPFLAGGKRGRGAFFQKITLTKSNCFK